MNTRRFLVHLPAAVFAALLQLRSNLSVAQEPEARLHVRQDMTAVYLAFKELQPFLARREEFLAEHNEKRILELVFTLAGKFQHVQLTDQKYMSEPGFNTTLEVLNEMLIDARNRFQEGKKSYALWRLKTSASYCISCHTRHSVPMDFSDVESSIKGMNILEQSEFYLATRQFDKASQGFLATVYDPAAGYHRMEALRRWLIIQTRVHPDPDGALSELLRLRGKVKLSAFEDEEVLAWVESLRRWKGESKADIPPLVKAENLVRQSFN
ncbi:MAG: hypothetical protein DCC75_13465, partial [Proteobacteria bacterium]